jgi:hypothetical protein
MKNNIIKSIVRPIVRSIVQPLVGGDSSGGVVYQVTSETDGEVGPVVIEDTTGMTAMDIVLDIETSSADGILFGNSANGTPWFFAWDSGSSSTSVEGVTGTPYIEVGGNLVDLGTTTRGDIHGWITAAGKVRVQIHNVNLTEFTNGLTLSGHTFIDWRWDGTVTNFAYEASKIPVVSGSDQTIEKDVAFSYALSADTFVHTWSISAGSLPAGLSFLDGVISGTPTAIETQAVTFQGTNELGNDTVEITFTVEGPPVLAAANQAATVDSAFSFTPTNNGSAATSWSVTSGTLPTGLSLNSSTGEISGTPTTEETQSITVQATNAYGSDTVSFDITVTDSITVSSQVTDGSSNVTGVSLLLVRQK